MTDKEIRQIAAIALEPTGAKTIADVIAEAKRRGLIEQNPLEKWDGEWANNFGVEKSEATIIINANAMRDYLLSQLEEAKQQRIGCGKEIDQGRAFKRINCGVPDGNVIVLCDDCIKRMREGK